MISFASINWLIPAVLAALVGLLLVRNSSRRGRLPQRTKLLAVSLKIVGLLLLAMCLIEPVWSGVQPKPYSNLFLVLADNSRSVAVSAGEDSADALSEKFRQVVAEKPDEESWLQRLGQDFELHTFTFDRRLRHIDSLDNLRFDGESSSLKSALKSVARRFHGRPVGGIVLLSDGNATDVDRNSLAKLLKETGKLPPIYPVVFETNNQKTDLAIATVSVSETPFEDAPVSIQCDVDVRNLPDINSETDLLAECRLVDLEGKTLKTEHAAINESTQTLPFRFEFQPIDVGVSFYRLIVEARDVSQDEEPELAEATVENNARLIQVDRGTRKKRVLYLCGRPNWEFKFLNRAVEDDDQIDLVGLIRVAKREAKFDFRGRDGQTSNSIFRGFKSDTDEETERFDEPVIVRLNTKDAEELRAGFPQKADELFEFDAIILDDVEAGFFKHEQLVLIEKFVSERGGGLLMLGGAESFQTGDYDRTPIADVLPVYLDRTAFPGDDPSLTLTLTREGWLQPWVRLRATEQDEQTRLSEMPGFKTLNPSQGIKPGSAVLSTVGDGQGKVWPALVTQQYGRGRAGAMLIGDLWRWQLKRTKEESDDLAKAWRQTIRWLVADVPQRVDLRTEPADEISPEAVRVRVRVADGEFGPLDNARVEVRINGPAGIVQDDQGKGETVESQEIVLDTEASLDEPGVYTTVFVPQSSGAWRLVAEAITSDGDSLIGDETGHIHQPSVSEFQSCGVNHELLEELAERTGGELIHVDEVEEFVAGLHDKPMPVMTAWTMPLWDQPLVFLVVLGCLLGEWGLRRSKGLA